MAMKLTELRHLSIDSTSLKRMSAFQGGGQAAVWFLELVAPSETGDEGAELC